MDEKLKNYIYKKEYIDAELTVVALYNSATKKYYNVYSVIEMCPKDQLKSPEFHTNNDAQYPYIREKVSMQYSAFFYRTCLKKEEVEKYWDGKGDYKRSITGLKCDLHSFDELFQEPPEGSVLVNDEVEQKSEAYKLLPKHFDSVRIATLMCRNGIQQFPLATKEFEKLNEYFEKYLGISMLDGLDLIGSIVLCMPNPYLRDLHYSLYNKGEAVDVQLKLRENVNVNNLRLCLQDKRKLGIGFILNYDITKNHALYNLPYEPDLLRVQIFDEDNTCIEDIAQYFIKTINMNMNVGGSSRVFQFVDNNGSLQDEIIVPMVSTEKMNVGDTHKNADEKYKDQLNNKIIEQLFNNRTLCYFTGGKQDRQMAMKILRELIQKAEKECIICDSYFSAEELKSFGIYLSHFGCSLKIITSAYFLRKFTSIDNHTFGEQLLDLVLQLKNNMKFDISVNVLQGKDSPLHDRWLIIDDIVYMLGSSLNSIGQRASCILKVPNGESIRKDVDEWIINAPTLEDWIKITQIKESDEGAGK